MSSSSKPYLSFPFPFFCGVFIIKSFFKWASRGFLFGLHTIFLKYGVKMGSESCPFPLDLARCSCWTLHSTRLLYLSISSQWWKQTFPLFLFENPVDGINRYIPYILDNRSLKILHQCCGNGKCSWVSKEWNGNSRDWGSEKLSNLRQETLQMFKQNLLQKCENVS